MRVFTSSARCHSPSQYGRKTSLCQRKVNYSDLIRRMGDVKNVIDKDPASKLRTKIAHSLYELSVSEKDSVNTCFRQQKTKILTEKHRIDV